MKRTPQEFAKVIRCDHCSRSGFSKLLRDDTFNLPWPGYIGSNYESTRLLLVGQNPGTSPKRFSVQDREFADAQLALRDNVNHSSYQGVKRILDRIMPTWPIVSSYFPLAECGLDLNDIANVNVVRCRTVGNAPPNVKIAGACVSNHFVHWLDWLRPRVVVCIGKWAHDRVAYLLDDREIPHDFVNRRRSLSGTERRRNIEQVVALVHRVLAGKSSVTIRKLLVATPPEKIPDSPNIARRASTKLPADGAMTKEEYAHLFRELGFHDIEIGKTLKHWKSVPSLYFNQRYGLVTFVGYAQDEQRFPPRLWDRLCPQKKKDDKPILITIVPKTGSERDAFAELLS